VRILVAGGAGFLGSHLCDRLISLGHYVIALDNFFTSSPINLSHLKNSPNFELIRHDVNLPIFLEIDGIFNLASPASPVHYQRNPVQTIKTNVQGSINLLGLAKRTNARILQASTSEIYGDPTVHPQVEGYWGNVNPIGIRACYDEGKRAAETLFFDYQRQYGVDIRVARIFNTYGPRMALNDGRVVSNFILQALTNQDITIYGDGSQTRSFCYVSDLIEGLVSLFFTQDFQGPVNLGNPAKIKIRDLANEVIALTDSKSSLDLRPLPEDDPRDREPDITKARELLGWEPKVDRVVGLKETIKYIKSQL
jgi:UDP-glucuronate decarboxylase